jgi:hypothetical protein
MIPEVTQSPKTRAKILMTIPTFPKVRRRVEQSLLRNSVIFSLLELYILTTKAAILYHAREEHCAIETHVLEYSSLNIILSK